MDKKSQHVGNHGGRYTDESGMSRQFTYIDHDKKTKIGLNSMSDSEFQSLKKNINTAIDREIDEILALPAVNISNNEGLYDEFIIRDQEKGILWHESMVRDACRINDILRHNLHLRVWRNTVKEKNWFVEMSHEDILAGKWKELT